EIDSLLSDVASDSLDMNQTNPLLSKLMPANPGNNSVASAMVSDTATIGAYLRMPEIRRLLPNDMQFTKFLWERPSENVEVVGLASREAIPYATLSISGDVVSDAQATLDQYNHPAVSMTMTTRGAKEWEELTGDAYNNQAGIAIVLDNKVYTAPGVSTGPISGGRSEITGTFTVNETKDIANVLRAGKLPASADIM